MGMLLSQLSLRLISHLTVFIVVPSVTFSSFLELI